MVHGDVVVLSSRRYITHYSARYNVNAGFSLSREKLGGWDYLNHWDSLAALRARFMNANPSLFSTYSINIRSTPILSGVGNPSNSRWAVVDPGSETKPREFGPRDVLRKRLQRKIWGQQRAGLHGTRFGLGGSPKSHCPGGEHQDINF